ncbi:MAG: sigma-70 family RNA polymerase sigma factor [Pirellulaceae bacterium]
MPSERLGEMDMVNAVRWYLRALRAGRVPGPTCQIGWTDFFARYDPPIRRMAFILGVLQEDVDDCVQEVWAAVVRAMADFQFEPNRGRFDSWFLQLVRSRIHDFLRSRARWRNTVSLDVADSPCCALRTRDVESHATKDLVRHVIAHLKQEVSQVNYRLIHLRWIEGLPVEDIAIRLHLTPQQVWYRHHRIKRRLRKLFIAHDVC